MAARLQPGTTCALEFPPTAWYSEMACDMAMAQCLEFNGVGLLKLPAACKISIHSILSRLNSLQAACGMKLYWISPKGARYFLEPLRVLL